MSKLAYNSKSLYAEHDTTFLTSFFSESRADCLKFPILTWIEYPDSSSSSGYVTKQNAYTAYRNKYINKIHTCHRRWAQVQPDRSNHPLSVNIYQNKPNEIMNIFRTAAVHRLVPEDQRQGAEASIWSRYVYGILYEWLPLKIPQQIQSAEQGWLTRICSQSLSATRKKNKTKITRFTPDKSRSRVDNRLTRWSPQKENPFDGAR